MRPASRLRAAVVVALMSVPLALAPAASAHTHVEVGQYSLTVGWRNEPAFVGQPNAVEVTIETADDAQPVTDLAGGALTVVVSTADASSQALPLEPGFSIEGGFGTPGRYEAELMPTTPGEYTFTFSGTIHGHAVDVAVTSGEETFSPVASTGEIEFPVKVPTLADVATRLERIDGRIQELGAGVLSPQDIADLRAATTAAREAADAATRTALIAALVGAAGLAVASAALWALRSGRRGAGAA